MAWNKSENELHTVPYPNDWSSMQLSNQDRSSCPVPFIVEIKCASTDMVGFQLIILVQACFGRVMRCSLHVFYSLAIFLQMQRRQESIWVCMLCNISMVLYKQVKIDVLLQSLKEPSLRPHPLKKTTNYLRAYLRTVGRPEKASANIRSGCFNSMFRDECGET